MLLPPSACEAGEAGLVKSEAIRPLVAKASQKDSTNYINLKEDNEIYVPSAKMHPASLAEAKQGIK